MAKAAPPPGKSKNDGCRAASDKNIQGTSLFQPALRNFNRDTFRLHLLQAGEMLRFFPSA
jgi:hypothetical protein